MSEGEDRKKEQIESYLLEKTTKMGKPLAELTEQMGEKGQQSRSGSGVIAPWREKGLGEHHGGLCAHTLDCLVRHTECQSGSKTGTVDGPM